MANVVTRTRDNVTLLIFLFIPFLSLLLFIRFLNSSVTLVSSECIGFVPEQIFLYIPVHSKSVT